MRVAQARKAGPKLKRNIFVPKMPYPSQIPLFAETPCCYSMVDRFDKMMKNLKFQSFDRKSDKILEMHNIRCETRKQEK